MYADKKDVRELLAKCVVPQRSSGSNNTEFSGGLFPLPKLQSFEDN